MRPVVTTLAALALAVAAAVTAPGPAEAAQGTLVVDGKRHQDPSGCFASEQYPMTIANNTDSMASVFDDAECSGTMVALIPPGGGGVFQYGSSVQID
ncbi:hypothetical protein LX15_001228 [Streptoalloteichus tenebrarius]|uniref:Secreted protein n=1 Tax=Streptoalloteichus tenebrarius (strain ATCC 17920 / DSM 40477 / JCM 4838 / CBS 697.72 / NBRC 16177 / NCIMB 11028 / NRRL B-12390 / A12253. 1 / ISP 5477) TaxID=1933 RepID=A0ABT1HPW2_STRSD|nr:hypothetical protein [Streptoalloteichus tenebrarius]MCP2257543.1 hypothetical protein [Streptoalloteichus tenebrarius]BFE98494.1 hypothetical protein GCM10020241_01700 [Streptoalloteichus tenebrarius]